MATWIIIFLMVLVIAIVIYAAMVRRKTDRDEFMEKPEPGEEDKEVHRTHSPLR